MSLKYYILSYTYWEYKVILESGIQLQSEKEVPTNRLFSFQNSYFLSFSGGGAGKNILNASFGEKSSMNSIQNLVG